VLPVLALAIVFAAAVRFGARPPAAQPAASSPTVHPLTGKVTTMYDEGYPMGIGPAVAESAMVAEVDIELRQPLRFNTPDGALPSWLGAEAADWIYQPARLSVHQVFKGPEDVRVIWIPVWGGARDGYSFVREPSHGLADGQRGIAFLTDVRAGLRADPWFVYLEDLSAGEDDPVRVMHLLNWYALVGDRAIGHADESEVDAPALREELLEP
jgi:hypothetical protein